jgi:sugar lactone lactonase YvrE
MLFRPLRALLLTLAVCLARGIHAQATAPALAIGSVALGSSTTGTVTFTFTGTQAISSVSVVTQGSTALDFQINSASPGNCTTVTPSTGGTCTVGVKFTPLAAGNRYGAALLVSSGSVIATGYLSGVGSGGQLINPTATLSTTYYNGSSTVRGLSVDAAGDLFAALQSTGTLYKYPAGSTSPTTLTSSIPSISATAVDGAGNVFAVSTSSTSVYEFVGGTGSPSSIATLPGNADNNISVDAAGNLYTTDVSNGSIYKVAAGTHTVSTLYTGSSRTYGAQVDAVGDVYVVGTSNGKLSELVSGNSSLTTLVSGLSSPTVVSLDPAGNILVCVGNTTLVSYAPGTYAATTLAPPCYQGMAVAPTGTIYVGATNTSLASYTRSAPAFTASTTAVNSTSSQQTVTVQNIGTAAATATGLATSGPATQGPGTTCTSSTSLAINATCVLGLQFSPTANSTPQTGTLTFSGSNFTSFAPTIRGTVSGYPYELLFGTQPSSPIAAGGNVGTVTVKVADITGVTQTTATNSVTLTVSATGYTAQTYTQTAVNGIATFDLSSVTLTKSGTYTYAATSSGLNSVTTYGTVTAAAGTTMTVVPTYTTAYTGYGDATVITVADMYGNTVAFDNDILHFTSSDAAATLPANTALVSGTLTVSPIFNTTGTQIFTATDITTSLAGTATVTVIKTPTYTVTSASSSGGTCTNQSLTGATLDSNCTLAQAIATAPTLTGIAQPVIYFSSALTGKTISIAGQSIAKNLNISGPGASYLTITGGGFAENQTGGYLTISGVTFGSGSGVGSSTTGAVHTVNNSVFNGTGIGVQNGTTNANFDSFVNTGYGINTYNEVVNVNGSTFQNGTSSGGAAIYLYGPNSGANTVKNSYFSGMVNASGTGDGSAIFMYNTSATLTISNSTFYNNGLSNGSSYASGGAVYIVAGGFTMSDSLVYGNYTTGPNCNGGGITASGNFYNVTITGNSATCGSGGGYHGTGNFYNSYIGGNTAGNNVDVYGTANNYSSNIDTSGGATSLNPINFAPLGNYGGPTIGAGSYAMTLPTMPPLPGTALTGAGSSSYLNGSTTDERGFPNTINGRVDIGSFATNYTAAFVQEPTSTGIGTAITPSPSVQLYESSVPFAASGVSLSVYATSGTLSGTSTATTNSSGIVTFGTTTGLSIATPQSNDTLYVQVPQSYSGTSAALKFYSTPFNVTDLIGFATPPPASVLNGGNAGTVTVQELNANGTVYTSGSDLITLKVTGPSSYLQTYTANAVNGVASFNLASATLATNGTYTYVASSASYTAQTVTRTEAVASAILGSFTISGFASPTVADNAYTITVTAKSTTGTTLTGYTGAVSLTSNDPLATITPPNYTFQTQDAGVHTFTVTLATPGTQSFTVTDAANAVTASQSSIQVTDYVWLLSAKGTFARITEAGSVLANTGASGTSSSTGGIAFDGSGNPWSVTSGTNSVQRSSSTGTSAATYTGGGLNSPDSIAVDGAGYIWVANSGTNTISAFNNSGTAQSGTAGYGSATLGATPSSIAIDTSGGVWVTSKTGNSVTHIIGAATPVTTPLSAATTNSTLATKP